MYVSRGCSYPNNVLKGGIDFSCDLSFSHSQVAVNGGPCIIFPYVLYNIFLPTECAYSDVCRRRLLFLDICDMVLTVFSRAFFKEHFFSPALQLGNVSS